MNLATAPILDQRLWFPNPEFEAHPRNGLVAQGGDLSVSRLLLAYQSGIFPWTVNPITWWSPDPRAILELDELHIPRSLHRILQRNLFRVTFDKAFRTVIEGCCAPASGRERTWISREFVTAYTDLHLQGSAHSVECWLNEELVGGIYGVAMGGLFAGESMFYRVSNASKVALYHLVRHLRACGFVLFDIQMVTPVTGQLGARAIPRHEYLSRLRAALSRQCKF